MRGVTEVGEIPDGSAICQYEFEEGVMIASRHRYAKVSVLAPSVCMSVMQPWPCRLWLHCQWPCMQLFGFCGMASARLYWFGDRRSDEQTCDPFSKCSPATVTRGHPKPFNAQLNLSDASGRR